MIAASFGSSCLTPFPTVRKEKPHRGGPMDKCACATELQRCDDGAILRGLQAGRCKRFDAKDSHERRLRERNWHFQAYETAKGERWTIDHLDPSWRLLDGQLETSRPQRTSSHFIVQSSGSLAILPPCTRTQISYRAKRRLGYFTLGRSERVFTRRRSQQGFHNGWDISGSHPHSRHSTTLRDGRSLTTTNRSLALHARLISPSLPTSSPRIHQTLLVARTKRQSPDPGPLCLGCHRHIF